tara:strand:+ start:984 stop:1283 length:300 start_codon:yes stop_codon:yes gene_type:complete
METTLELNGTELHEEIRKKQAESTLELIDRFINNYPKVKRKKQIGKSSFYKKRYPLDSELDPNKSIIDNFNLLRISNNNEWPSFFIHKGIRYIIKISKD